MIKALWVIVCIIGLLASVFNWDYYFRTGRAKLTDDMLGREAYRVINAVICIVFAAGGMFFFE